MQKSGSEILIYVLLIGGFLLFNYIMQQLAKKAREQQEAAEREAAALEAPDTDADADVLEDIWGRPPQPALRAAVADTTAPPPRAAGRAVDAVPARQGSGAHMLFRDTQDLRHAIVLMTVLGPCRALDPQSDRH